MNDLMHVVDQDSALALARDAQQRLQRWWDSLTPEQQQARREQSKRECEAHRRRFLCQRP